MNKAISTALLLVAGTALATAAEVVAYDSDAANDLLSTYYAPNYEDGQSYSLSFTISAMPTYKGTNSVLTLADSYYIDTQAGLYVGLSSTTGSVLGWTNATNNGNNLVSENGTNTITYNDGTLCYGWISTDSSGTKNIERSSLVGTVITVSYVAGENGATGTTTLTVDFSGITAEGVDTAKEVVVLNGTEIKFSDLSFGAYTGMQVSDIEITGIVALPEPSSFGLLAGLGALAFVAARRRRSRKAA